MTIFMGGPWRQSSGNLARLLSTETLAEIQLKVDILRKIIALSMSVGAGFRGGAPSAYRLHRAQSGQRRSALYRFFIIPRDHRSSVHAILAIHASLNLIPVGGRIPRIAWTRIRSLGSGG
jgi:hypothetical protein